MEPTFTGANFAPQGPGCGTEKIQTNDSRIQNVVWRNGSLWTTHTVFLPGPDRASVQWWEIQPNSTVNQRGLIDDPSVGGSFYAFPSIAVNQFNDVLLGFSSFAPDEFASARYAFRLANDPDGTMQQPLLLKPGEDCYFKDYTTGKNRWGASARPWSIPSTTRRCGRCRNTRRRLLAVGIVGAPGGPRSRRR
jgi:hypothetical protein